MCSGEALGAIGSESVHELLKEYACDPVPEVSCVDKMFQKLII